MEKAKIRIAVDVDEGNVFVRITCSIIFLFYF